MSFGFGIRMRKFVVLAFAIVIAVCRQSANADVHSGYRTPTFVIPYAVHPPRMNGQVSDADWQNALSMDALQTTDGNVSTRGTTFWLAWDEDHLYIAMRSALRPGERLMQANRQPGRDNSKVVFDDAFELWINASTKSPDGEPVLFQYLANYAGAKYDVMFEPAVGNSRPGWESGWQPVSRVTPDGKFWEMTVAIPRQSIYRNAPFSDRTPITGLLVRDFKRPWEQNNVGGSGSFAAADAQCKFILSRNAPAIHLINVADPAAQTFGLNLSAIAATSQTLKWSFESDGGASKSGLLPMRPGQTAVANPGLNLDRPGTGYYRIRVTSEDGIKTYVDWCSRRAFGDRSALTTAVNDTGREAALNLTFNPIQNYVRVEGDFIEYDDRSAIHRFVAEVRDAQSNLLVHQDLQMDSLAYVHGLLHLPDCPAGPYVTQLIGYDAGGKEVFRKQTPFVKKDLAKEYPWWNTKVGRIDRVIQPWTPVRRDGARINIWGRSMTIGDAGLPAAITTQGAQILAAPATLVGETSDGKPLTIAGNALHGVSDADYRVVVDSAGSLGNTIDVSSRVTAEFDGMYKIVMNLTPRTPTAFRSLKVVVPLRPEFADYFNACGEGIRYGFSYGYLPPDKTGTIWDSKQVDGQPMLVGSFIPYVWVGNDKGGLCWFADSDAGWSPNDQTPAIELRRDAPGHVDLVLNLISAATTLDEPRSITFAFQATPVKPLRPGWRMDTWSTDDTFQDFCQVQPRGGQLIWNALPFTLDATACRAMVQRMQQSDTGSNFGFKDPKYHLDAVPYFENNGTDPKFAPASGYFSDEWHARVSDSSCFCASLTDFIVYNLDQWCKQTGIDGWYVDNVRPVADDNIDAGRGYRLPDGRIQPSYQMFATRDHFLRVRAMFQDNGKAGKFVLHMTNHMIMPWVGAADLALDGEDHVTFPEMGKDFIDFWSPARMRLDYSAPSGTAVTFLQEYQGNWTHPDLMRVMRAYTAMTILHDVLPGGNPNGNNQAVWIGRHRFGIDNDDVKFVPYWQPQNGITCDGKGMLASAWVRKNSILVAVANRSDSSATATVHLDLSKFGLPAGCTASDAETGAALAMKPDGTIVTNLPRHDYQQIMISDRSPIPVSSR